MNRQLTYLIGSETAMALLTAPVFIFCARHSSYSTRDVDILERLMLLLPVIAVPLARPRPRGLKTVHHFVRADQP